MARRRKPDVKFNPLHVGKSELHSYHWN